MAQYEIKDVVCDYGIYEDGELILILNSAHNAHLIKRILEIDTSVPNAATPADFVEVVRCCECKSAFHDKETNLFWCARMNGKSVERNHFCSYGVRKG